MKTVCEKGMCSGCMACADRCPKGAIHILDYLSAYDAVINEDICIGCGACEKVCQRLHPLQGKAPAAWYQGWSQDEQLRHRASSGGAASALAEGFVRNGGEVCSCVFHDGRFFFAFAETLDEIGRFTGSKYVKSDPSGLYPAIQKRLFEGKPVLFIGLPCQSAALQRFLPSSLREKLYTIDLICHGTPSPALLDCFLSQYHKKLDSIRNISFRVKAKMQLHADGEGIRSKGVSDKYTIAFLNGLTYTENCYDCAYARTERISDLTLGDSWGSDLPMEEQEKGVSLILCQNTKGHELLKWAALELLPVNPEKAVAGNHQLEHPSVAPKERDSFFAGIQCKKRFNHLVFKSYPKQCLKQDAKELLLRLHLIRLGDAYEPTGQKEAYK